MSSIQVKDANTTTGTAEGSDAFEILLVDN